MAKIKSFSDLQQSKKLAEILPLESADNVIVSFGSREGTKTVIMPKETLDAIKTPFADIRETTMCWSLAALLGIIQKTTPYKMEHFGDKKVQLTCVLGDKPWALIINDFDNEVDACVAMIEKLHELKML